MRRIHNEVPVVRVDLGNGDWVAIKAKRLLGDKVHIDQAAITGHISTSHGEVALGKLALGATVPATLIRMVVDWGGPGFCTVDHGDDGAGHYDPGQPRPEGISVLCRPIPCTRDSVMSLDDTTAQTILNEIEARNPAPRTGDEANPTSAAVSSG